MTAVRVTLLCGILLLSGGCFLSKKPAVAAPVATAPTPAGAASAPPKPAVTQPVPAQPAPAAIPAAPPVDAAKPSPFPPAGSVTPLPKQVTPAPVKPAPALGAILTADQRKQLDAAYQSDLRQANLVLTRLSGRSLTSDQTDSVSRARAFIRQAAQYHDRDLATAAELARRARVLTQDLAAALK